MNNLIIFATFWNEIEWIDAALEQMLSIDPIEIVICDGNFDSSVENRSTDGTRELLNKFVADQRGRAQLISAERTKPISRGLDFYLKAGQLNERIYPSRINYALRSQFLFDPYRVNQSLTFSKMINLSSKWKPGRWVMSYDADQFYSDDLIESFSLTNSAHGFDVITADERTFPHGFEKYTTEYESRTWNNMPHKIRPHMAVYPTRHFVVESMIRYEHIHSVGTHFHAGEYFHYKFRRDQSRLEAGYKLGDRSPPDTKRFSNLLKFDGEHPQVIKKHYAKWL